MELFHLQQGRQSKVKVQQQLFLLSISLAEIPQTSVLPAKLFSLFTVHVQNPPPNHHQIKILQYANDLIIYSSMKDIVSDQACLNSCLHEF